MSSDTHSDDDFEEDTEQDTETKKRRSVQNRKLVRWNPDMDQLVLLTADTVMAKLGHPMDWNSIAKHIHPWMTGEAIKQHLTKVYNTRVEANMPVPVRPSPPVKRKDGRKGDAVAPQVDLSRIGHVDGIKADYDASTYATPSRNAGLLHFPALKSAKAMQKLAAADGDELTATPTKASRPMKKNSSSIDDVEATPVRKSNGHSKGRGSICKKEAKVDPVTPPPRSSTKRGRVVKPENVSGEEEALEAPSAPKRRPTLRNVAKVNYNDQLASDDEVRGESDEKKGDLSRRDAKPVKLVQPYGDLTLRSNSTPKGVRSLPMPRFGNVTTDPFLYHNASRPQQSMSTFGTTNGTNDVPNKLKFGHYNHGFNTAATSQAREANLFGPALPHLDADHGPQHMMGGTDYMAIPQTTSSPQYHSNHTSFSNNLNSQGDYTTMDTSDNIKAVAHDVAPNNLPTLATSSALYTSELVNPFHSDVFTDFSSGFGGIDNTLTSLIGDKYLPATFSNPAPAFVHDAGVRTDGGMMPAGTMQRMPEQLESIPCSTNPSFSSDDPFMTSTSQNYDHVAEGLDQSNGIFNPNFQDLLGGNNFDYDYCNPHYGGV